MKKIVKTPCALFIDTEFTDQCTKRMISIGVKSIDGPSFYAQSSEFRYEHCSAFVKEHVLPLLDDETAMETEIEIGRRLSDWISTLKARQRFAFNHPVDMEIAYMLLQSSGSWPKNLDRTGVLVRLPYSLPDRSLSDDCGLAIQEIRNVEQAIANFFETHKVHHALSDATAMQIAWQIYARQPAVWAKINDLGLIRNVRIHSLGRIKQAPSGNYRTLSAFEMQGERSF